MAIIIQNSLRVLNGRKVMVPGCEPLVSPSTTLAANIKCNSVVVDLDAALAKIPGSYVVATTNPRELHFVLPSGPPPGPDTCKNCNSGVQDWYAMLKEIGEPVESDSEETLEQNCQNIPQNNIKLFS